MKKILVSTLVCALFAGYLWIQQLEEQPLVPPAPVAIEAQPQSVTIEARHANESRPREFSVSRSNANKAKVLVVDESKLAAGDRQLGEIITEFDDNLGNPEKRRELEIRLSEVAAEYKQQVLAKVKLALDEQNRQTLE